MKVRMGRMPLECLGTEIKLEIHKAKGRLTKAWDETQRGVTKAQVYFNAGYSVMQHRMVVVGNAHSGGVVHLAPLQERENAAIPYHMDPMGLEMQAFSRNEVSSACPMIAGVGTDRGLTCRNGRAAILHETVKNYAKLFGIAVRKRFRRNAPTRTEGIYAWPFMTPLIGEALDVCAEKGLIKTGTCAIDLPDILLERLIVVGLALKQPEAAGI